MSLVRGFATVGGLTMVSRVLGFVRDILIASVLGTGPVADAFFAAFRFPNLFRRLFAEGAFNSAFVPLYARRLEGEGADAARRFASEVLSAFVVLLLAVTALAQMAMPWLMYAFAPGFAADPGKFDQAVLFSRICLPYLVFLSLAAMLGGILNSLGRFAAAAAAPVLLNVVLIGMLLGAARIFPTAGHALSWGVAAAGALQFLVLVWACARAGVLPRLARPRITPGVRRLVKLGVPGLAAGGIVQLNIVIGTIIASIESGAVSFLYYADRIYQLPLGIVGVALGVVLLPDLSRRLRGGHEDGAQWSLNRALEFGLWLTLPAAAALIAIPEPIVRVLFEHGAFGAEDTAKTALALAIFALGLPAFVLIKVLQPGFFAREDTMTPMKFSAVSIAINIAVSIALFPLIGAQGVAAGTTLSAWVNVWLLWQRLAQRGHLAPDARLRLRLPRTMAACAGMAAALTALVHVFPGAFAGTDAAAIAALAALVAGGTALYFVLSQLLGAARLGELRQSFARTGRA